MTDAVQDKIIGGIFDLAKVALGAAISWISAEYAKRKEPQKRLKRIVASILAVHVDQAYSLRLKALRVFFEDYPEVLDKHPANCNFNDNWLSDPVLLSTSPGGTYWTPEKIQQLKSDVKKLKA